MIGVSIQPENIITGVGPLKDFLIPEFKDKRVFVVGVLELCEEIAEDFGLENPIFLEDVLRDIPSIINAGPPLADDAPRPERIDAILLATDPKNWFHALQICLDLLTQDGQLYPPRGTAPLREHIPVFSANPDLRYGTAHPTPRITMGCFTRALGVMYTAVTGQEMRLVESGKPSRTSFDAARRALERVAGRRLERIYMIGDNPSIDVKGANRFAAEGWISVLVETGSGSLCTAHPERFPEDERPRFFFPGCLSAARGIIAHERARAAEK